MGLAKRKNTLYPSSYKDSFGIKYSLMDDMPLNKKNQTKHLLVILILTKYPIVLYLYLIKRSINENYGGKNEIKIG